MLSVESRPPSLAAFHRLSRHYQGERDRQGKEGLTLQQEEWRLDSQKDSPVPPLPSWLAMVRIGPRCSVSQSSSTSPLLAHSCQFPFLLLMQSVPWRLVGWGRGL
jgi:hypothetical protein